MTFIFAIILLILQYMVNTDFEQGYYLARFLQCGWHRSDSSLQLKSDTLDATKSGLRSATALYSALFN